MAIIDLDDYLNPVYFEILDTHKLETDLLSSIPGTSDA
jgi:hypothetical protein